jgi:NADPH:quinone reductase
MRQVTNSIRYHGSGKKSSIVWESHELRELSSSQIMVKVSAAGLNRADLLQRQGLYKVPKGATDVPGVEIAGNVVDVGSELPSTLIGKRVCGVVNGGGFSEYCILESGMMLEVPAHWSDEEAAAFSEAALTANEALNELAQITEGSKVLLHAASSGIGTMLVVMARELKAEIICTTSSNDKSKQLYDLGASHVISQKKYDFIERVNEITRGEGVDAVVDFLAGGYFNPNVAVLKEGGRLIMAGIMDGRESPVNWIPVINKQIKIKPLTLRMKQPPEKEAVTKRFIQRWWDGASYGGLNSLVDSVFPVSSFEEAQLYMSKNKHVGKIVITI